MINPKKKRFHKNDKGIQGTTVTIYLSKEEYNDLYDVFKASGSTSGGFLRRILKDRSLRSFVSKSIHLRLIKCLTMILAKGVYNNEEISEILCYLKSNLNSDIDFNKNNKKE